MNKKISLPLTVLLAGLGLAAPLSAPADELSQGAMLSASCEACHGTNGNSPGTIPSLTGRSTDYLLQALAGFKSGERQATVMDRHVRGYTDQELQLIAEHFAQQNKESE
jgi:sulfide dehydrogenase cytochrome subunit